MNRSYHPSQIHTLRLRHFSLQINRLSCIFLFFLCVTCSDSQIGERDAWLSSTLIEDHYHLIARSPDLVSGKFLKMVGLNLDGSSKLYPYMRGTLGQMYRDLAGDYIQVIPSRFASENGILTQMIGDPHIENVSSVLDHSTGLLGLDWDDFDSAGYGPWIWDVRRLALSFWVLSYDLGHIELSPSLITAMSEGYLKGVSRWSTGERLGPKEGDALPKSIRELFEESRNKANRHHSIERYTSLFKDEQGRVIRSLRRGEIRTRIQEGVIRDAVLSLSTSEKVLIDRFVQDLSIQRPKIGKLKDVVRKFGQGVSSYPLMRFYLLFEGASLSLEDDELWEAKELADRPVPPELKLYPPRQFGAQGQRVIQARKNLQWIDIERVPYDAAVTWIDVGNASFRAYKITDLQQGLNTKDLIQSWQAATDELSRHAEYEELLALASLLGELLASSHCFAETMNGLSGGAVISQDLTLGGVQNFSEELRVFAANYGPQIEVDRAYLLALINERGPLLGLLSSSR